MRKLQRNLAMAAVLGIGLTLPGGKHLPRHKLPSYVPTKHDLERLEKARLKRERKAKR